MTRIAAWDTIRGRRRGHRSTAPSHRGPRLAALIATEHAPDLRVGDPFDEWRSLEFRHLTPPSDEGLYR